MVAPVDRPSGVLAGTFGVGILTFLLLPSEVGYQDLAALIARDVASVERSQKTSAASSLGAFQVANLNLPQPVGSSIKPPLGYTLAALDPNNAEITGSIRERILRESALMLAPDGTGPWVDRSRKSDQLTATPRGNDHVAARKGDRLAAPSVQRADNAPNVDAEAGAEQVAAAPSIGATVGVEVPTDIEAEHLIAAEKQVADAVEQAAKLQVAELPPPQEADTSVATEPSAGEAKSDPSSIDSKPAERGAETRQKASQQAEKRTRQTSKRAERVARAQRDERERSARIAREAREKAEKLARSQDAPAPAAKLARTSEPQPDVAQATPTLSTQPVEAASAEPNDTAPADANVPAAETARSNGFVLASAGDYRIGIDTRQFERVTAPAAATAAPSEPSNKVDADAAKGKGDALPVANVIAAAEGLPTQRTSRLFFGVDPMGKKVGGLEPWKPGLAPKMTDATVGDVAANRGAAKDAEIKLAALPPVESATDSTRMPGGTPDQSVGKDPNAHGGQTIAPKGEVTGADKRPMTPAERLGLNDEKSRAKSVKCLTEVIYFEARGEVVRGQMAVAQVVLNRAFSGKYPTTVCGVVYQNAHRHLACQFTFACDGIADRVKEPDMWERATVIANEMLDGKLWLPEVGKATHYHAHWVHPGWVREMNKLHRVGVHTFYRPRAWGDGTNAPEWGDVSETQEVAKKLVEVAKKP